MVKAWQYYFLIRDLNADVKVMNACLCKHLPPEAHLEALGGASDQQDLRSPSRTLCSALSHATRPSGEPGLWRKMRHGQGVPLTHSSHHHPPDPMPPPTVTATDRLDRAVISPSVSPALPDCRSLQLYCLLSLISPLLKVSYPCPCRKLLPGVLMTLESNREDFKSRV